jgi:integrase/recombinase XerD
MADINETLDAYDDYLRISTKSSLSTIKKYRSVVRHFLLQCHMEFNLKTINAWIATQNRNKSTYIYKYALQHFLNSIGKKNLGDQLVSAKKKPRMKVFNYIPKDRLEKIINSLEGDFKRIAFLQFKTGARISTILTLRAENIDFNISPDFVYIKTGIGKSLSKRSKEVTLRLSKKYEPLFRSWIPKHWGFIFLHDAEKLTDEELLAKVENVRRQYDDKLAEAGKWHNVDGFSSHYLRHLYADYYLKAGGDPIYLQKLMGHSDIKTTMGYVSVTDLMAERTLKMME